MSELALLAAAGGLLALDGTSVGQVMVSRPLVAGTVTGWLLGVPGLGFALGAVLEVYLLVSFPVGGSRFPEGAPATVIAVATAASSPLPGAEALGIATGLVWGQLGGITITWLRLLNARLAPEAETAGSPRRVVSTHLLGILADFLRGTLLTGAGLVAGELLVDALAPTWPLGPMGTRGLILLGGMVSLGILVRSYGGLTRRGRWLAAGAVGGLLLGWLL